ncbi:PcfB family protein [Enterocloster sp.]|jgi:hypothetical protein|uniref:PcfB family protein n=1 Tax=Enterocloster TaxID=2719313 RepID=UPI002580F7C8|nr:MULTISPECIES: PcfB family protein [Enterocloster]MBS5406679.1 DUF3801 domain-containing protein [Enterocloster sp.]MDM8296169.1 PcfB family protein [Enterocloster aldenensis]
MQEDINNRTASLVIQTTKLTARTFKRLLEKALAEMEAQQRAAKQKRAVPKTYKGKQSVRQLVGQGAGVSNIEITDKNIKGFERTARKYGVDFAVKRDNNAQPPKYLVFFKAKDADALIAAFTEYSQKRVKQQSKPSILARLSKFKELVKGTINRERHHDKGERTL